MTGRSLVQRSRTEFSVSECGREASILRGHWPTRGCWTMGGKIVYKYIGSWYEAKIFLYRHGRSHFGSKVKQRKNYLNHWRANCVVKFYCISTTIWYFWNHSACWLFFIVPMFNLLKPTGHVMHQQFNIQQLYVLPTLYLCVLYLSVNKQRLVPLTA